jgi:serine phosphatase RsbU (regulator of sigma subunit)
VSSVEEDKAIARRFEEELAKGNLDVKDELAAPDFVNRSLMPGQGPTREDFKRSVAENLDAFPITRFTIEEQIRERERVEQELRLAQRIQRASLPSAVPELEDWEIFPHCRPAREVGGDFYDFIELQDGHLGLVVGDATGKGVPAALVSPDGTSQVGQGTNVQSQARRASYRPEGFARLVARVLSGSLVLPR